MSIKIKDTTKKYLLDWDETLSELHLLTYSYTTWNPVTQEYDTALTNTTVLNTDPAVNNIYEIYKITSLRI